MRRITREVEVDMAKEQKAISRQVEPKIKNAMCDGYECARTFTGTGSFMKQKVSG